jgi:hypothetical protein
MKTNRSVPTFGKLVPGGFVLGWLPTLFIGVGLGAFLAAQAARPPYNWQTVLMGVVAVWLVVMTARKMLWARK